MSDVKPLTSDQATWLGLIVGNTRLHWALFQGLEILKVWHTRHYLADEAKHLIAQRFAPAAWRSPTPYPQKSIGVPAQLAVIADVSPSLPLYCASVVPAQTELWQSYPGFRAVRLEDLPLGNLYPTLGVDRALNLLGAGDRYGWPILVIDAGTALTFTAGDADGLIGGAILPGFGTQFNSLTTQTAALPAISLSATLPPRWSANTPDAIRSGIIHGLLATVQDFLQAWYREYPDGQAILTGGDAAQLYEWLLQVQPELRLLQAADLAFWGLCGYRQHRLARGC